MTGLCNVEAYLRPYLIPHNSLLNGVERLYIPGFRDPISLRHLCKPVRPRSLIRLISFCFPPFSYLRGRNLRKTKEPVTALLECSCSVFPISYLFFYFRTIQNSAYFKVKIPYLHPKGTYSSSIYLRTSSADLNAPLPDVYIVAGKAGVEGPGP